MGVKLLESYVLGDMKALYFLDDEKRLAELMLLPAEMEPLTWTEKHQEIDALIQLKLEGDVYTGAYAGGKTMRQSGSVQKMKFERQEVTEDPSHTEIITCCRDDRGYEADHHLIWKNGAETLESFVVFRNQSASVCGLELLESFSIGGITPFAPGDAPEHLVLHRLRSDWSMEGRLESDPLEKLNLEPSWSGHGIRCERFGQVGSMAVNHFFPWLMMEDRKKRCIVGCNARAQRVLADGGLPER